MSQLDMLGSDLLRYTNEQGFSTVCEILGDVARKKAAEWREADCRDMVLAGAYERFASVLRRVAEDANHAGL